MTEQQPQVVVVTGSSGGVGRAIAHAFAKRGAHIGLLARGAEALDRASRRSSRLAGRRSRSPPMSPTTKQVEAAAEAVEARLRPDRRLGQRCDGHGVRTVHRYRARGVQARDRSHLSGHRVRDDGRRSADDRRAIAARSSRSARRWPTGRSRCRPPTAGPSSRSAASPTRSAPSCCTTRATCTSRWSSCPGSTRPSSTGAARSCPIHPKPVPPIYQPEIPAEAVYWAAHHRRRELWVGYSAVQAILGNRLAPSFADWYLARTGFKGQQMQDRPVEPPTAPTTCSSRSRSWRPPTASSTTRPRPAAPSCGRPPIAGRSPGRWPASRPPSPRHVRGARDEHGPRRQGDRPTAEQSPHVLREYALLADGERGVLVGPRGDFAWMCFPRWDSSAVFAVADRRAGRLRGHPPGRYVWGGYYEAGTLIWRSRWVTDDGDDRVPGGARPALDAPTGP